VLQCNIWTPPHRFKKKMTVFIIFLSFGGKVKNS
jgi:hypothetical protein